MSALEAIDLKPKEFIDFSPAEFLDAFENDRDNYESFFIIPPKLGTSDFGRIRAKLLMPIYVFEGGE